MAVLTAVIITLKGRRKSSQGNVVIADYFYYHYETVQRGRLQRLGSARALLIDFIETRSTRTHTLTHTQSSGWCQMFQLFAASLVRSVCLRRLHRHVYKWTRKVKTNQSSHFWRR